MSERGPDPHDPSQRKVVEDIAQWGWHVVGVHPRPEDTGPYFNYTVGLFETHGHAELVIAGLGLDQAHAVLDAAVHDIAEGARFRAGDQSAEILENFDVRFGAVGQEVRSKWTQLAAWYYGDEEWDIVQLLVPDPEGRFPGDPGYHDQGGAQPLLANAAAWASPAPSAGLD